MKYCPVISRYQSQAPRCHQPWPSADDWVTACTGLQHRQHQPGPLQSITAAFLVSDWFLGSHSTPVIGHTITSPTCTDLCCTPGCSLPSSGCYPWLLIGQTAVMKGSDWPSFWLCILLSASHPGSGSADQERLRDIWQNKSTISKSKHQIDKHFYLIVLVF